MSRNSSGRLNSVFYAESYHPIQAGSIDGTDVLPTTTPSTAPTSAPPPASMTRLAIPRPWATPTAPSSWGASPTSPTRTLSARLIMRKTSVHAMTFLDLFLHYQMLGGIKIGAGEE
ncbi:uncharacterized protein LOC108956785 [Eucalyptus grandis]|uniref:uncharacterized protein LOC108956785 n=1 Tax=Eucalyptus grandis TaxID=71139 RepID=UPI00192ECFCF|nr:uncharacterized protein LOC108956785 [Eucalyptus grandis]